MAMLSVRINRFEKKAGRKMKFNNKDAARFDKKKVKCYKCSELGHFAREYHKGEDVEKGAAQVYGMIAGAENDAAGSAIGDVAINVSGDVSDAATEFALMGISSQWFLPVSGAMNSLSIASTLFWSVIVWFVAGDVWLLVNSTRGWVYNQMYGGIRADADRAGLGTPCWCCRVGGCGKSWERWVRRVGEGRAQAEEEQQRTCAAMGGENALTGGTRMQRGEEGTIRFRAIARARGHLDRRAGSPAAMEGGSGGRKRGRSRGKRARGGGAEVQSVFSYWRNKQGMKRKKRRRKGRRRRKDTQEGKEKEKKTEKKNKEEKEKKKNKKERRNQKERKTGTQIKIIKLERMKGSKDKEKKERKEEISSTDDIDHVTSTELPFKVDDPIGFEAVRTHMMHGPCGDLYRSSACMSRDGCVKGYPKEYSS
ncbi:ribonuclease H-like domain-containing protein [Tanacetum coccineum]